MTDSAPLRPDELGKRLRALAPGGAAQHFVCAVSGGPDSLALLHAAARCPGITLRALHVDHKLHPDSGSWADTVVAFCAQLGAPCDVLPVAVEGRGSVEADARAARYAALAAALAPGEALLTAHHREDQALTLILQLLRGAGPAGLAAMPEVARLGAGWHLRPLLTVPAETLRAYCATHGIAAVHDPSNDDERFDRNYLRRLVVPALAARWPQFDATLSRSAAHCAAAAGLLEALAGLDAGESLQGEALDIAPLRALGAARMANAVRAFLRARGMAPPNQARLDEFVRQLVEAAHDRQPALTYANTTWRVWRDRMHRVPPAAPPAAWSAALEAGRPLVLPADLGQLLWRPGRAAAPLTVRFRRGGECFGTAPQHKLKTYLQARGVLPWLRGRVPLVLRDGRIVAIAGLWQDADLPGRVQWHGAPTLIDS